MTTNVLTSNFSNPITCQPVSATSKVKLLSCVWDVLMVPDTIIHQPAARENVEYKAFQWHACLYILLNGKENIRDAIKAVYAEWPFGIKFFPPQLFKWMGPSLKTYQKYGNAVKSTKRLWSRSKFLKELPSKEFGQIHWPLEYTPSLLDTPTDT